MARAKGSAQGELGAQARPPFRRPASDLQSPPSCDKAYRTDICKPATQPRAILVRPETVTNRPNASPRSTVRRSRHTSTNCTSASGTASAGCCTRLLVKRRARGILPGWRAGHSWIDRHPQHDHKYGGLYECSPRPLTTKAQMYDMEGGTIIDQVGSSVPVGATSGADRFFECEP